MTLIYTAVLLGVFVIGIIIGYIIGTRKMDEHLLKWIYIEKAVSVIVALSWLGMSMYSFFHSNITIPYTFDAVGMGAMAHIIGLDLGNLFSKYNIKGKK